MKSTRANKTQLLKQLRRLRETAAKSNSALAKMTPEEVIEKLRKDRERIWEEKFAARP
ncbi:MAG: hypothetical protein KJ880_05415 [Candidatus Omnitrophica bacterium]|nr:hypothetical protein [Candidatus Omnitrophota bacterium]